MPFGQVILLIEIHLKEWMCPEIYVYADVAWKMNYQQQGQSK